MAIPYAEIKNAFTMTPRGMSGTSSWIRYSHYYPDFDFTELLDTYRSFDAKQYTDNFTEMVSLGFDLISHFHENVKIEDFFPNYEFDFSRDKYEELNDTILDSHQIEDIRAYVYNVVSKFSEVDFIFRKLRADANLDYSYDVVSVCQTAILRIIKSKIIDYNFDVITYLNYQKLGFEKSDIGMALINDNKGVRYKTKIGKAIGIMYPKLPKSLIGYMVEAIKESQEEYLQELYVHEGFSREHFRYGYMKAARNDKSPYISKPATMSLVGSCLRGQVEAPEIGITNPDRAHMTDEVFRTGIHPAEAYASGDFSIVYISDKEDPFDPTGTVYSRCVVTHYQIDRDKVAELDFSHNITDKPVVNISPVYITSKVNESLMFEYLEDKYSAKTLSMTTKNHDIFRSLKDNYGLTKPYAKRIMIRYPRLLAISMEGEILNVETMTAKRSNGRNMSIIAPYLDRNTEISSPVMVLSDDKSIVFNNVESEPSDQIYCYMLPYKEYDGSVYTAAKYFNGYSGYNTVVIPKFKVKCDISGEFVNSETIRKVMYLNGTDCVELNVCLNLLGKHGYTYFTGYSKIYLVKKVELPVTKYTSFKTITFINISDKIIDCHDYEINKSYVEQMLATEYFYKYKGTIYETEYMSRKEHLTMIRLGYKETR